MKVIFFYFLCILTTLSSDRYIPKNSYEKKILEKYQKQEIVLAMESSFFNEDVIEEGATLNSTTINFFKNYLGLNIKVKKGSWEYIYHRFLKGDIDILAGIVRSQVKYGEKAFFSFSVPVIKGDLYLSSNKKIRNLKNLNNETIYLQKSSGYNEFLYDFLAEKGVSPNLVFVENNLHYQNGIVLISVNKLPLFKYNIKLEDSPNLAFGINNKYRDLLPIINSALEETYIKQVNDLLDLKKGEIFRENFRNSLSEKEKEYLSSLKNIKIIDESNFSDEFSSSGENNFLNKMIYIFKKISTRATINIENHNTIYNNWPEIYRDFLKGEVLIMPMVKYNLEKNDFYFTQQIDSTTLYKVESYSSTSKKVGVVKNSLEHQYALKRYLNGEIIFYKTREDIKKALERKEIKTAFLYSYKDFDLNEFNITKLKEYPVYLAVKKENEILGKILNKALNNISDLDELKDKALEISRYSDYLEHKNKNKKLQGTVLILSIVLGLFLINAINALIKNRLKKQLKTDILTGFSSRGEFIKLSESNFQENGYCTVIEIDDFRDINEKYGVSQGDIILLEVSKLIREIFIETALTYRYSNNKFYIFLMQENIDFELMKFKNRTKTIQEKLSLKCKIDLSIGYYFRNNSNISLEESFGYANIALDEARKIIGTSYVESNNELIEIKIRERKIKELLKEKKLSNVYPVFQPKYSADSEKVIGAEALARWSDKNLGFISPGEFIPIAENLGLVHLVDYKIAKESMKAVKHWLDQGIIDESFKLSFNMSMETFNKTHTVMFLDNLIKKYGVPAKYLEIEVTESILSDNIEETKKKLLKLRKIGFQISIDDFTAGHSAATLLNTIPAQIIKFDKSILDTIIKGNYQGHRIYKNLITLVKDLDLIIVAEGVENQYQMDFLKENKVDIVQGFLLSKPISKDDFEKILKGVDKSE